MSESHSALIGLIEEWRIVEPRLTLFQTAINVALHDLQIAHLSYGQLLLPTLPFDHPSEPRLAASWRPPLDVTVKKIEGAGKTIRECCETLGCYVDDFRDQMQKEMLGHLFPDHPVPPRQPFDQKYRVVDLSKYDELMLYFENETAWGKEKKATLERVEAANKGTEE